MGRILYSPPICVGAANLCHMVVADSLAVMATGRAWGPGAGGGEGGSGGAGRARWLEARAVRWPGRVWVWAGRPAGSDVSAVPVRFFQG